MAHAVSQRYMQYNFARPPQSLTLIDKDGCGVKRAPATAAGVTDHIGPLREIAALLD